MKLTLHTRCLTYFLLLLFTFLQFTTKAQVKAYENFEYTSGDDLVTKTGGNGFTGPWFGRNNGSNTPTPNGNSMINAANLDGNTLGGSVDLSGGYTERYRNLSATINNTVGTSLWVAFSYKVDAGQSYSGLSLFNGTSEHVYIGRNDNDLISLGGGAATQGGVIADQAGFMNVADIHYYLAKIDFLGGSDIKVYLWADYTGTVAPDETDLTYQTTAYYNNAAAITQIRIAGNTSTVTAASFDGIRLSSAFFEKSNYTLVSSDVTPPSVPTALASTNITDNAFTLSWTASTDNVGVAGYDVFRDGVYYGSTATTTLNITGLSALTTYSFTVKAKDAAANLSAASAALSVTTLDAVIDLVSPTAPTALVSSAITATTFTLSWAASTDDIGVTGYDIYKDGILVGSSATTSYNATGLTAATTYIYTVKAKDASGNESLESDPLSVTTITGGTPPVTVIEKFEYAPGNLDAANGGTGFSAPWAVSKGINIETGDLTSLTGTPAGKARFVDADPRGFRDLSKTYLDEAGKVYWIEFSMQGTKKANSGQGNGIDSMGIDWGGISLFNDGDDNLYMGLSDDFGVGFGGSASINKSLYGANHYLVKLVMSGDNNKETAYMWLNYTGGSEPAIATANITASIGQDGRLDNFNRIRLAAGGAYGTVPDMAIDNIAIYESYPTVVIPPVTLIEKFEYAPGNLDAANGGSGFSAPWAVSKGINIESGDLTSLIGTPAGKARFVDADPRGFRDLSKTYLDEAGKVYWIEFSMQGTKKANSGQGNGIDSMGIDWGGISLFNDGDDNLYMGLSDDFGVGFGGSASINKALYGANHYLVKLVMSGDNNKETAYMWLNYTGGSEPAIATANITASIGQDGRLDNFNRIRLAAGGAYGTVPDMAVDDIAIYETYPAGSGSVAVQSVLVTPATASVAISSTQQLSAAITPANASNTTVNWSSSNNAVATVSNSGLVTGVTVGTVTITATTADGNKTSTASITVTATNPSVTVIEKFEYAPGNLDAANGGSGFSAPWGVSKGINIESGDLTSLIGTPAGKARFVDADPRGFRDLSKTYLDEAGKVYWIEFSMQGTKKANSGQGNGIDSMGIDWGGISLFNDGDENFYIGLSDDFGIGFGGSASINKSLYSANHYLVKLVMSGDNNKETAYMWLNYTGGSEPAIATANITASIGQDGRLDNFNRIRLAGAGAYGTVPDIAFDNIRISETFSSFGTLPVTLVSFNAAAKNNGNSLSWKTSAEINTVKFIVERKEGNSGVFKEIGNVAASQNINGSIYQFYDAYPFIGNNYYRLKIVDADGRFTYSAIINIASARSAGISIYPNPANNGVVNIVAGAEPIKSISVINITGIRMMNINAQSASRNVPVNVNSLRKGIYIFEIVTASSVVRKQVIIE